MNEYVEIKVWHIVAVLFGLFTLYVFTTGYGCGFFGSCEYPIPDKWQGTAISIILAIMVSTILTLCVLAIVEDEGFSIKNPFYNDGEAEAWKEYQQWLKERKK